MQKVKERRAVDLKPRCVRIRLKRVDSVVRRRTVEAGGCSIGRSSSGLKKACPSSPGSSVQRSRRLCHGLTRTLRMEE
jgi:hypothetical protein